MLSEVCNDFPKESVVDGIIIYDYIQLEGIEGIHGELIVEKRINSLKFLEQGILLGKINHGA